MVVKYCKWCGVEITLENRAIKNSKWGIHIRNECKPCRSKQNVLHKKKTIEEKSVPCPNCGKPCIKRGINSFCSVRCTLLGSIKKENDCWIWQGHKRDGYGKMHINGKETMAHRVSYELFKGQIGQGMLILHSCNNPSCINPDHLRQGTDLDNTYDKLDAGRDASGWDSPCAMLTEDDIVRIRQFHTDGKSQTELMKLFNIGRCCIQSIIRKKTRNRATK